MNASRYSRRDFLALGGLAAGGAVLLGGCGGGGGESAGGPTDLSFWNAIYTTSDPEDKSKKRDDFYIYGAIERFQRANEGVRISISDLPGDLTMFTKYRTASIAKDGPDTAGIWSGSYSLSLKQFLEPMTSYFSQEEMSAISGWNAMTEGYEEGAGTVYGVPAGMDGISALFFDRDLLSRAGVDLENDQPESFDAFLEVLERVEATGVTPLVMDQLTYTVQSLNYWIAQTVDGEPGLVALVNGERNFSDPEIVAVIDQWKRLRQYSVDGVPSMQGEQAFRYFYGGEAAMTFSNAFLVPQATQQLGDRLGMIKVPDISEDAPIRDAGVGGAGVGFVVSNYSENKEETVAFLKFLMSPEEQRRKVESGDSLIANVKSLASSDLYDNPLLQRQFEWVNDESGVIFYPDNIWPPDLVNEYWAQAELAWTDRLGSEEFMQKLDAKRDELKQQQPAS